MQALLASLAFLASALPSTLTPVRAQEDPHDRWALERSESPYFSILSADPSVDRFPLEATEVTVSIEGVLAEVQVRQRYRNEGDRPLSARYVFPASVRAAVHGMSMTLEGRTIYARIEECGQARETFEEAKAEGRSASLLEQERPNVFQMEVANILPGETIEVELEFTEFLVPEDGVYEFVYPTVVGPRYSDDPRINGDPAFREKWTENPYLGEGVPPTSSFSISASIATGIPLAELACPTHSTSFDWSGESSATVTLDASEHAGGDRDFILQYRLAGDSIQTGLLLERAEGQELGHFLLMVQPPAKLETDDIPPREYVYILDVSGSMNGPPLNTARRLIRELVRYLRPTDTFNIVLFAGSSDLLAPESIPATEENLEVALNFVSATRGSGWTDLFGAMDRAISLPRTEGVVRSLLVVTDGYIAAESAAFKLIHDNISETNVFAFGIGASVNRYLVEGIARAGQGEATIVTSDRDAKEAAARFRQYISTPVLTNIELSSEGFELLDREPAQLATLMASRPLVVSGRWRGEPQGLLRITGVEANGLFERTINVGAAVPAKESALPLVWARQRIAALSDWNFGDPSKSQEAEVLELGLSYGLLTEFTSFVAVTEEVRTDGTMSDEVVQPLPLPKGVSDSAVGHGVGGGDEPALFVLALLAAALYLGRRYWLRDGAGAA